MFATRLNNQNAEVGEYVTISPFPTLKHSGTSVIPQYIGLKTVVDASSTPNQNIPPIGSGSQLRLSATNTKPVCWVAVARSLQYSGAFGSSDTFHVRGRQRYGTANGPAPISFLM